MKKKLISIALCIALFSALLVGCGSSKTETTESESTKAEDSSKADGEVAESDTIVIGIMPTSGHVLSAIAEDKGFYEEEGISVEYEYLATMDEAFAALTAGKINLLSTYGTAAPLLHIAMGEDLTIFAGYYLTGCMGIVAKPGTEFNGIESMVGKKIVTPGGMSWHPITGALLDAGYDPAKDVEIINGGTQQERVEAIRNGDADFAVLTTGYATVAEEAGLEVVCYSSDIMPDYSCCRAVANTGWLDENPTTVKKLLKSWLRALSVFENDREYGAEVTAKQLDADIEYVRAYMLDEEHFKIQVDPSWTVVERAWNYDKQTGVVENDDINLADHFNADFYKAALDECMDEYYDEAPEFYDSCLEYYNNNDAM